MQQVILEGGKFECEMKKWNPALKHSGVYVAPRFYSITRPEDRTNGVIPSHHFGLTTFGEDTPGRQLEDGDEVTLQRVCNTQDYDAELGHYYLQAKSNFTARAMVARPLTHLTIRL